MGKGWWQKYGNIEKCLHLNLITAVIDRDIPTTKTTGSCVTPKIGSWKNFNVVLETMSVADRSTQEKPMKF